jgi:hypothetical protein
MVAQYRFAGSFLAQATGQFDPQHQNNAMLELNIDRLVPGGRDKLALALQEFTMPQREMQFAELPYLNGTSNYGTRVSPLGNMSVTFRDFPELGVRGVLNDWFQRGFDEVTGLALPPSLLKVDGFCVLVASNATQSRTALLQGILLAKQPEVAANFAQGEVMLMQVELKVDRILWDPIRLRTPGPPVG